jgi:hypothetical protein
MSNGFSSFGFQSRKAQLSYPVLIFAMLLIHHFVYPDHPELRQAEFALSIAALVIYIISKKFLKGQAFAAYQTQLRLIEKLLEVFIGITVVSSLAYSLLFGVVS